MNQIHIQLSISVGIENFLIRKYSYPIVKPRIIKLIEVSLIMSGALNESVSRHFWLLWAALEIVGDQGCYV
jgi:hypothetical protein